MTKPCAIYEAHRGSQRVGWNTVEKAALTTYETDAVEEVLEQGLRLADASPAHLPIRGIPALSTVRCVWGGVARTARQLEHTIRFWLRSAPTDPIRHVARPRVLFSVLLHTLNPEFRETAKANLLANARGEESMNCLFLTCFAKYAVTNFLLGGGTTPTTVTVAYDRLGEVAFYDPNVHDIDSGTYGSDPIQPLGEYKAA